jgi:MFS superfamily sulfate permease-like transporter
LQGGNYTVLVGIALMLLLWGARKWAKLDDRIDKRIIPVVAVVIGIGAECLIALAVGGPVTQAVAEGLLVGLVASGSWTAAGKHLLPAPPKKEEPRDDA